MAKRLTGFSKLIITLIILALLFFGGKYILDSTSLGKSLKDKAELEVENRDADRKTASTNNNSSNSGSNSGSATSSSNSNVKKTAGDMRLPDNTLKVQLVTWGGYAPGLYFNAGHLANTRSRFYKDYGFKVDFKLENDLQNAMDAWIAGEYDVLVQTADAFPLYTGSSDINRFKPKAFMQVDWSRGGDALIVKRGINTINDLKGKKIAIAVPSPAQTLLMTSLEAAGLKYSDVQVIKTADNLKAAELFRSKDVDAAVVWSPDDIFAVQEVPGSKVLLSTVEQSHIIADIMFAKEDVINANKKVFDGFYEGWMKGVAEMKNKSNQELAAKYLAELNQLSPDDAMGAMSTVHWTSHEDNRNFFGLNSNYKGQKGSDLYNKMNRNFVQTQDLPSEAPNWRSVIYNGAVRNANLTGTQYKAEGAPDFKPTTAKEKSVPAFATKPISINFASGQYALSENAKTIIDLQFADVAKSFANVKIRIEGNTDNVGARAMNLQLSEKRAKSVADYLKQAYGMNSNRFVILGNGPDKPTKGCESNANEACKAKNRRTDFQLIPAS